MAKGEKLGSLDCPYCGYQGGMRFIEDKNGDPYGVCKVNCDGTMRVGGDRDRVDAFYKLHPGIKRPGESPPRPAPGGVAPVAPAKAEATETKPESTPAKPARKSGVLLS